MKRLAARYASVALSLAGSAILLFSCEGDAAADKKTSDESMMTEYSENLSVIMSENGRRSYHFETPLVEGYSLAREPYREFRKGVRITTYRDDSLSSVDAVLTANYAIYYEKRELWEAKGNVVVEKSDGKTLYTQQLFWNARTKKIYSNVDSKIVQTGGRDVFVGEGFESDEEFKDWRFRRMKGRMEVDVTPSAEPDSTAGSAEAASAAAPEPLTRGMETLSEPAPEHGSAPRAAADSRGPATKMSRNAGRSASERVRPHALSSTGDSLASVRETNASVRSPRSRVSAAGKSASPSGGERLQTMRRMKSLSAGEESSSGRKAKRVE